MDTVSTSCPGSSFPYHFQDYETQKYVLLKQHLIVFLLAQQQVKPCYSKSTWLDLFNHQRFIHICGLLTEVLFMVILGSQPVYGEYRAHTQFRNLFPNVSVFKELNNTFIFVYCLILTYLLIHTSIIKARTMIIMDYCGFLYY